MSLKSRVELILNAFRKRSLPRRFPHTYRSAAETLKHYQAAKIEPVEGNRPLEINVWTLSRSQPSPLEDGGRQRVIVEIQDNGHDGGGWDVRCW